MENLGVNKSFWNGKRVLVTGHTGFKGAWLVHWLQSLGCQVSGLSLAFNNSPNLWTLLEGRSNVTSHIGDIRDPLALEAALADSPDIVFHLAAQSLVRPSYKDPVETFSTNVTGTVALLHQISRTPSVKAVVVATSDKVYENLETGVAFSESDQLGGSDPYSASKGACEIAVAAMRRSYFGKGGESSAGVATARAGNVIGGGDWSVDRLVPDIVRGCLSGDGVVTLRAPTSIRPWQHVLEPLGGYIKLAERLFSDPEAYSSGFNFGPAFGDEHNVQSVAEGIVNGLGRGEIRHDIDPDAPKESTILRLNAKRANEQLAWQALFNFEDTLALTARWYAEWHNGADVAALTASHIDQYTALVTREC